MAKFQDKHLKLRYDQRAYFGDSDDCSIWHDSTQLRVSCTISGVDPTQPYHLTTVQYFTSTSGLIDHGLLTGLGDDDHPHYILVDGSRDFTGIVNYDSHPTFTNDTDIVDKKYVDDQITTLSGMHDEFIELIDTPVSYTGSGSYVVTVVSGEDGLEFTSLSDLLSDIHHHDLLGLDDDDHTQYILVDGSRGFTATVSGVHPIQDNDLATKWYVDQITGAHKESGREALSLNDSSKAITFSTAFGDANYSVSAMLNNTTDANPSIYPMIITNRTSTGFTVLFSGDIDSGNYFVEWLAVDDD